MSKPNILVVLASAAPGWYLSELAHPFQVLSPHCSFIMASPKGGATILDPVSVELVKDDRYCIEFMETQSKLWLETQPLSSFLGRAKEFFAIFYVGGLGPMFDLVTDTNSLSLIREFYEADRYVTAICHGTVALVNATLADGSKLIAGEKVTGFSNAEEVAANIRDDMPFHLEDALNEASGGLYEKAKEDWGSHIVVSATKKLITGQNPGSGRALGEALLKKMQAGV